MARLVAILSGAAIVGLLAGVYFTTSQKSSDKFAQCRSSQIAGGSSQIGGPFTLLDESGETVTDKDVINQPSLIYFGYTYCPDVCPVDVARNAATVDLLKEQGKVVKPVFISIDPERDTPEVLQEFTDYMHPDLVGLTGTAEQIRAASRAYKTYYAKRPAEDGDEEFYLMDHSVFTYLTLPDEGFVEFFRNDLSSEQMADQVACFLDAS